MPYDSTYMCNLKMNLPMKQKQIHRNRFTDPENRLLVSKKERIREGTEWEAGVSRCKLLYTEWINNRSYYIAQRTIFNIL